MTGAQTVTVPDELVSTNTAFLLDLDGTLYREDEPLPGAIELLRLFRKRGHRFALCSNNSSAPPQARLERLQRMGFDVERRRILTSLDVLLAHLREKWSGATVYAVATRAVQAFLGDEGVRLGDRADVVVLTYDTELTYAKLARAHELLSAGAGYVATHPDIVCPTRRGDVPDCGAFIALLAECAGRRPEVLGKPHRPMLEAALRQTGASPEQAVVVGDRLYTDIRMANDGGVRSILVFTGEATPDDLRLSPYQPTYALPGVHDLAARLAADIKE